MDLILEAITPAHAPKLFQSLQAPELYEFIPQNPPTTIEKLAEKYTAWAIGKPDDGQETWLNYAVYCRQRQAYVGTLQATIIKDAKTYIAYEVFPQFWQQGIATKACSILINLLLNDYNVATITAHLDTKNIASYKLLEKLGFQRTQTLIAADTFKDRVSDEYVYELNK